MDNPTEIYKIFPDSDCFYQLLDYDENATYNLTFTNNSAQVGGKHIFGAPLKSYCTLVHQSLATLFQKTSSALMNNHYPITLLVLLCPAVQRECVSVTKVDSMEYHCV